jgi:hypothetical protein
MIGDTEAERNWLAPKWLLADLLFGNEARARRLPQACRRFGVHLPPLAD